MTDVDGVANKLTKCLTGLNVGPAPLCLGELVADWMRYRMPPNTDEKSIEAMGQIFRSISTDFLKGNPN